MEMEVNKGHAQRKTYQSPTVTSSEGRRQYSPPTIERNEPIDALAATYYYYYYYYYYYSGSYYYCYYYTCYYYYY